MKGIILAAGKGTRLYPMTKPVCKPLLPVYDKPLIYYPVAILMQAGISDILIIVPPDETDTFAALLGDGSQFGLHISYAEQPVARGIADALLIGSDFVGEDQVCLVLGDNIFYAPTLGATLKRAVRRTEGATVFGYWVEDPRPFGVVEFDDKAVSKETKVDILVTPLVTIFAGVALAAWWAPAIGKAAAQVGALIRWATELQPFWMGIIVSVVIGIALTLPISSAAICAALTLTGLAGGAAVAGCCANMVGFAVLSFKENGWGGLVSQGIGTSMLQMPNIVKNPRIWLPAILTSAITGPMATCLFHLQMNDPPGGVASGMGTCGLVGQIGVYAGWVNDVATGVKAAITPMDWAGMVLICFILPAVLCWLFGQLFRKMGWIGEGDLTLPQ